MRDWRERLTEDCTSYGRGYMCTGTYEMELREVFF